MKHTLCICFILLLSILAAPLWAQTFTKLLDLETGDAGHGGGLAVANGVIYATGFGGTSNVGVLFSVNTDGTGYTVLHNFVGKDGSYPGGIILVGNRIYGTATEGGKNLYYGAIYAINTDGTGYTNIYNFDYTDASVPLDILMTNGILYGVAQSGGQYQIGGVFEVNTNGKNFQMLHPFAGYNNGDVGDAIGGLTLSGNTLYGTSVNGGANNLGTIYSIGLDGLGFTNFYSFSAAVGTPYPDPGLIVVGNQIWGTTLEGEYIYTVNTDGSNFQTLYTQDDSSSLIGTEPSSLVQVGNSLYGTMTSGGIYGYDGGGTIFSVDTGGNNFATDYSFGVLSPQNLSPSGSNPEFTASLVLYNNTLYGRTVNGGMYKGGTIFSFSLQSVPLAITTTNLADGVLNQYYEANVTCAGGQPPYTWSISAGSLPNQFSLVANGFFNGTPTNTGVYPVTFEVTDGAHNVITKQLSLTIDSTVPALQIETASLADGEAGSEYGQTLTATGGTAPYTWSIASGSLPKGLALNPSTGLISGTAINGGASNFKVRAMDAISDIVTQSLSIVINTVQVSHAAPTLTLTSPTKGEKWSNSVAFTITGTAHDTAAVSNVWVSLNNGDWTLATGSDNWSLDVDLTPGTNTVSAYAVDTSGRISKTNTLAFLYAVPTPLVVSTNGEGSITPVYNGVGLDINVNYEMTAKAGKGFKFVNWAEADAILTTNTELKFTMASGYDFTANFADDTAPTVTIIAPKNNAKITTTTVTPIGTASDNVGVGRVYFQINGGGWQPAITFNGYTNWTSASLIVATGANTLEAFALDLTGNRSKTNTIKFTGTPP